MEFEWDEEKNRENIQKHGFDFHDAEIVFQGPFHIVPDRKGDYGEERFAALGFIEDILVRLSYTMRGKVLRVISLRKATVAERRLYEAESLFRS